MSPKSVQAVRSGKSNAMAAGRETVREIGAIPAVFDPSRRERCRESFREFLATYMGATFYLKFSLDHELVIARLQEVVTSGGQYALAMPRGSGKTSLNIGAALWAILYGYRRFVLAVAASGDLAAGLADSFRAEIESNMLLAQDFPEVCYPVAKLEGIAQRANAQLCGGERTRMAWSASKLIMPEIPGSVSAGAVFLSKGITGRFRGIMHKAPHGETMRPDLVLLDDPQDDEIAGSPPQVDKIEKVICGSVLGLAGPGKKIAALLSCTVIERDDLADRLLDAKIHPEWRGHKFALVYAWPDEQDKLWAKYEALYREGLADGDTGAATAFYSEHREAMDAGARVAWPERLLPGELSAIQSAQNLLIERGRGAFFAEYQNDPREARPGLYDLDAKTVMSRAVNIPEFTVPGWAKHLVVFGDINHDKLSWVALALANDATAHVVAHGLWPEGNREVLVPKATAETASGAQRLAMGIREWARWLNGRPWTMNGRKVRPNSIALDANYMTKTVFQVTDALIAERYPVIRDRGKGAKQFRVPAKDKVIGRAQEWVYAHTGDRGDEVVHCADYWRMIAQKSWLLEPGVAGACTLFAAARNRHQVFADQVCAEVLTKYAEDLNLWDWRLKPGARNDLLDAMVGAYAIGCYLGATVTGGENLWRRPKLKRRKIETRKPKVQRED